MPTMHLDAIRGLKGVKEASLDLDLGNGLSKSVKVAVASGIANARKLVEEVRAGRANYDFVEVRGNSSGSRESD